MKHVDLEKAVRTVLREENLEQLKEWYTDTLQKEWQYVVFMARRSYVLALIMEKLTRKPMEGESRAQFLTDAGMFLHCEKLAEVYRKQQCFPTILLCDDVCIHGRNINHFIEMMEKELLFLLSEYSEEEIKEALAEAIRIHVYARKDGFLLLLGRYESRLFAKRRENAKFMHSLSGNISRLILCTDVANASYIYSERLTEKQFNTLDLSDYISTSYQNIQQWTKIEFIGNGEEKQGIFSLRIIKNRECAEYTVLPFVFMPNLDEEETGKLLEFIQKQMGKQEVNEEYIYQLSDLEKISGKRTFNELITLVFSQTLLHEFNSKYNIDVPQQEKDAEIRKLARNYNRYGLKDAKEWVRSMVSEPLFTSGDIAKAIKRIIGSDRKIICINESAKSELTIDEKERIKEKIEDYFYIQGSKEEREAVKLSQMMYFSTPKRSARVVRGCGTVLWKLNAGYSEIEAKYSMAYFLQMMDAGVLSLSSFASHRTDVVGFSQFAKAGEQSLAIWPLRYYEWMPMLVRMENECMWWNIKFETELEEYGLHDCPDPGLSAEIYEKLRELVCGEYGLFWKGHTVTEWMDWRGAYLDQKELGHENMKKNDILEEQSKFMDLQMQHILSYEKYRKN